MVSRFACPCSTRRRGIWSSWKRPCRPSSSRCLSTVRSVHWRCGRLPAERSDVRPIFVRRQTAAEKIAHSDWLTAVEFVAAVTSSTIKREAPYQFSHFRFSELCATARGGLRLHPSAAPGLLPSRVQDLTRNRRLQRKEFPFVAKVRTPSLSGSVSLGGVSGRTERPAALRRRREAPAPPSRASQRPEKKLETRQLQRLLPGRSLPPGGGEEQGVGRDRVHRPPRSAHGPGAA